MASMRNGSGDGYFLLFTSAGSILKGFVHDAPMSPYATEPHQIWPGVLDSIPVQFSRFLSEPAFSLDDTTFCLWRPSGDAAWRRGEIAFPVADDPDGSADLLGILDGKPQTYLVWAEEYYEASLDRADVEAVYAHQPLTEELIGRMNPEVALEDLAEDVYEIGYDAPH